MLRAQAFILILLRLEENFGLSRFYSLELHSLTGFKTVF